MPRARRMSRYAMAWPISPPSESKVRLTCIRLVFPCTMTVGETGRTPGAGTQTRGGAGGGEVGVGVGLGEGIAVGEGAGVAVAVGVQIGDGVASGILVRGSPPGWTPHPAATSVTIISASIATRRGRRHRSLCVLMADHTLSQDAHHCSLCTLL